MYTRAVFFASSLILTAGTSPALAADIYAPSAGGLKDPVIQQEMMLPEATVFQEYAQWYIRGDVGVGRIGTMDGKGEYGSSNFVANDINVNPVFSGSIGFGRYVTPHVRLGLDLDYRSGAISNFKTVNPAAVPNLPNLGTNFFDRNNNQVDLNSFSVMVNAVYDFRPGKRWSPYIGGGIGWVSNDLKLKGSNYVTDLNDDDIPEIGHFSTSGSTTNSVAASVTTGVSVNISRGLFLDVGYKFSYLGNAGGTSYSWSHPGAPYNPGDPADINRPPVAGTAPASGSGSLDIDDDILVHEFKIGLRYDLY